MAKDISLPRFEATADGACLVRPGVVPHQHFSRETAARFYRQLQEIVAPDEGRIIRHHAEMSKALSKNVKAAEALGLGCGDDIMLGIAKWAREYGAAAGHAREDSSVVQTAQEMLEAFRDNPAAARHLGLGSGMPSARMLQIAEWAREYREPKAEGHHAAVFPEFPGGQLDAVAVHDNVQIIARGGDFLDSAMIHVGHASARRLAQQILDIVGPGVEDSSGPEDLKDALLEVLEGRLAGKWQLGVALLGDCEEIAEAISSAINRRDDMWEKPLSAEDRAVLDWARQHVVARERDRFARSRFLHLVDRLLSDPPRSTPDADNPEPTEAENLTDWIVRIAERVEALEAGAKDMKKARAMSMDARGRRFKRIEERLSAAEERMAFVPHGDEDFRAAIDNAVARAVPAVAKRLSALETTTIGHHAKLQETEETLDHVLEVCVDVAVEKAVAPIRESVHEQLDKVLKAMEKTKDRVDGMLKATDLKFDPAAPMNLRDRIEQLRERGVPSEQARLILDPHNAEDHLGQRWAEQSEAVNAETEAEAALRVLRAQKKAIDAALVVADKMEAAENTLDRLDKMARNEPYDDAVKRRVTTPPRPEKDVSSQEED